MGKQKESDQLIHLNELAGLKPGKELLNFFRDKNGKGKKLARSLAYLQELQELQVELVQLQDWVQQKKKRVAILFEGRDAAGKGGTIRRFSEYINPRAMRVVALPKPSVIERGQWYFQRYVNQLPNEGEVVFFDRSWYNRAVVEPVNKFCSREEYERFMRQVPKFEHMLLEAGIMMIKFWFTIDKDEQRKRLEDRRSNPLKYWKLSSLDHKAQELWDDYSRYRDLMFENTHSEESPWVIVQANTKKTARLESMKYVLNTIPYKSKKFRARFEPDPKVVYRYGGV